MTGRMGLSFPGLPVVFCVPRAKESPAFGAGLVLFQGQCRDFRGKGVQGELGDSPHSCAVKLAHEWGTLPLSGGAQTRMSNTTDYKGYHGSVAFSGQDRVFHGRVVGSATP